jgi:hypothetical protein
MLFFCAVNEISCKKSQVNNLKVNGRGSHAFIQEEIKEIKKLQLAPGSYNLTLQNSFALLDSCDSSTCLSTFGSCKDDKKCECKFEYAHNPSTNADSTGSACSYERRKVTIALMLEVLVPFGFSHFYLGNYTLGMIKVALLIFLPLVLLFVFCYCGQFDGNSLTGKMYYYLFNSLIFFYLLGIFFWMILDIMKITLNLYKDRNGIELSPWI